VAILQRILCRVLDRRENFLLKEVGVFLRRGYLSGVNVHVTRQLSKLRRREVALRVAEVGRSHGYGFPTGDNDDIDALRRAGLFDETDPEAHQAYWDAREPRLPRAPP
jgi:hypothetical protein